MQNMKMYSKFEVFFIKKRCNKIGNTEKTLIKRFLHKIKIRLISYIKM